MALTANFTREPTDHGDFGVYHDYVMKQLRRGGEGGNSCYLYDTAGALYLSKGFFGINDGTTRGTVEVTTEGTISLVGLTASRWAKVEVSVSGAAVTFEITTIAAANSPAVLPTDFTGGHDGAKGGIYIAATKRCIGIVWINAGGTLEGIVNAGTGRTYYGYSKSDDAADVPYNFFIIDEREPLKNCFFDGVNENVLTSIIASGNGVQSQYKEFYLLKPLTVFIKIVNTNNGGGDGSSGGGLIEIKQGNSWRRVYGYSVIDNAWNFTTTIVVNNATTYITSISLNPGHYRIGASALGVGIHVSTTTTSLLCTGIYEINSISDIAKIVSLI